MKNLLFLFLAIWLFATCIACGGGETGGSGETGNAVLATQMDSMCYAIGASFSKSVTSRKMNVNGEEAGKGYMECKAGTSYINEQNANEYIIRLQEEYRKKSAESPDGNVDMNMDSLSYAMGCSYFLQLKSMGLELNDEVVVQGITDNLKEGGGLLDDQQFRTALTNFRSFSEMAQAKKMKADAAVNKKKGKAFLDEKAKEDGVKSTASGLLYKVLKNGSGVSPKATDKVSVHYEGKLIDGTIFDSSIQRGTPSEFFLNQVIKGWTEGLQLMKPGAKFQFYIPSELAYGDRGSRPKIGPGETLIFDVELLEIK